MDATYTHARAVICHAWTSHNANSAVACRGEQAAAALEKNLSNLESKLDEILASFEDNVPAADEKEPAQSPTGHGKEAVNGSGNDSNR